MQMVGRAEALAQPLVEEELLKKEVEGLIELPEIRRQADDLIRQHRKSKVLDELMSQKDFKDTQAKSLAVVTWLADANFSWTNGGHPYASNKPIEAAAAHDDILSAIHEKAARKARWDTLFAFTQQGNFKEIKEFLKRSKDLPRDAFFVE